MLLSQRAANAKEKFSTLSSEVDKFDVVSPEKQQILDEIKEIDSKFKVLQNELSELKGQAETSKKAMEASQEKLESLQKEYDQKTSDLDNFKQNIADYKLLVKIADSEKSLSEKGDALKAVDKKIEGNNAEIEKLTKKSEEELESLDGLNNQLNDVNANILAIEKILETSYEESSDASKWLDKNKSKFSKVKNLSDVIDVPEKYLNLVEALLGSFSASFVAGSTDISKIRKEISKASEAQGSLRLVSDASSKFVSKTLDETKKHASKLGAVALADEVNVEDSAILGALANVIVFEDSQKIFDAADKCEGVCCAALDGTIIYPDGRYLIGGPFYVDSAFDSDSSRTIISYKKNLEKLNKNADSINKKLKSAQDTADTTDKEIQKLREKEIELNNEQATAKAEYDFANNYLGELKGGLADPSLAEKVSAKDIDKYKQQLDNFNQNLESSQEWLEGSVEELNEARLDCEAKKQEYNTFEVKQAALEERINSQQEVLDSANLRLQKQNEKENKNAEEIKASAVIAGVCTSLASSFNRLSQNAKEGLAKLDASFSSVNASVSDVQQQSDAAIKASSEARKAYDDENEKLSSIQVELGKLEVQVQNAVDVIDGIEGISVDKALEMPDIENREEKEERQFKLRRRIANMGVINPDAKQEYDVLKERFDFLNGQVEDLQAAKLSLSKIDQIIEERMKDDFINTFDEVNANFQEIFAVLFPGGRARLELELPNDIENSGVEVKAQPHGKHVSKMSLLSGGEKSLVALCLLFAVYKKRSTPFYILDEVEAALDDTNLRRLIKYLEDLKDATQLIMITHQRRTMEMADVLYGVSMKNDGVTRVVSQKLDKDNKLHDIDK